MSQKDLKRGPHNSKNGKWWWYEERGGISLFHQGEDLAVDSHFIRWSALRAALKRKDKP